MRSVGAGDAVARFWTAFDSGRILPACAWCGHVRIDEVWLRPPRAALATVDERYAFSHSICDPCATNLNEPSGGTRTIAGKE